MKPEIQTPNLESTDAWRQAIDKHQCLHCGNGLGRFWQAEDGPFCCRGCKGVYEMIHTAQLERFYDLKPDTHAPAATLRPDSFAWLDRLLDATTAGGDSSTVRLDLDIQGIHCAACVWLIEELFNRQAAGIFLRINPTLGKVELAWDASQGDLKSFLADVEKFGYRLGPARKTVRRQSRALLMRMAVSIAMAMNVMMFSLSYYFGLGPDNALIYGFMGWLSLALATVSILAGGGVFLKGAWEGLRRGVVHLDLPISLGMVLAYVGSVYGFLAGGPEDAYFDTLTIFIALMLVGRWTQEHILERNRDTLLDSAGADNLTVKIHVGDGLVARAATEIKQADELWVAPGDLLPTDGILMRRNVDVSLDWITGESDLVSFTPGELVPAGAFNASEHGFSVTASQDFADSRLQDLLRSSTISDSTFRPRWWHRISTWYVTVVLIAATGGFLGWMSTDINQALRVAIAILVVTCPCALGLATPLAEELVHHGLRRSGVFLRKRDFLEKALDVRKVLLDKTGTVTMGRLILTEASEDTLSALDKHTETVLRYMTSRSNHPVSQCLAAALQTRPPRGPALPIGSGDALVEISGAGLQLELDDADWRLGKANFALPVTASAQTGSPTTPQTILSCNGLPVASFTMTEQFKADAATEIAALKNKGLLVYLLSGDAQAKVDIAAQALGLTAGHALGQLSPEAKADKVRALDNHDTLMVGDGLNDSPSFAAALCAATPAVDRPVLPGKADFFFLGDSIGAISRSLAAARLLRRVVRDNLVFAVVYNLLAVILCMAGLVTPVVAAILMPVSSVAIVSATAMRLTHKRLPWM